MGKLTILLGGARSGKSTFAERLAAKSAGSVLYLATAGPDDPEMAARIQLHQQQRPEHWQTLELPQHIGMHLAQHPPAQDLIILDCITLLISNVILSACGSIDEPDQESSQSAVEKEIHSLLGIVEPGAADWIIVSNEVGLGLVPPYPLGRVYRDILGWTNKTLCSAAEEIFFLVSGRILPLHGLSLSMEDFFDDG